MKSTQRWKILAAIAGVVLVADQVTKYLAVSRLTQTFATAHASTMGEKVSAFVHEKDLLERGLADRQPHVVAPFWQHHYTQNRGAAWGILSTAQERFRVWFFYAVSLGAVIFIFVYYSRLRETQRYLQIALALVLGGAVGNALDRVMRGYVIDFIDWHWFDPHWFKPSHHWPTFNVADSGISVGLVMLFLEMFLVKKPSPATQAEKKAA